MPGAESLAGAYQLHPGVPLGITGQRPVLQAGRLRGLIHTVPIERVPDALGSVFTLCAHAHRRTSRQALGLAAGPWDAPIFHLLETVRDHLRSMALDWPQRLATPLAGATAIAWLKGCPLPLAGPLPTPTADSAWRLLADVRDWLARCVLHGDVSDWLAKHPDLAAQTSWFAAHAATLLPAHCLTQWQHDAPSTLPATQALTVLDADPARQARQLRELAACIAAQDDFAQQPTWAGHCAENGPWTRARQRQRQRPPSPAQRLNSRWIDLLELVNAAPGGDAATRLSSGALDLGRGQTLAWCEMARGLLLHWARRDRAGALQDYKVIAPTEWNFHPQGTLSRALRALPAGDVAGARALAAAFDPCVLCSV